MTDLNMPFAPNRISPPGDTIAEFIKERNWSQSALVRWLGYTEKHVSRLVNGIVPLTEDAAFWLERVIGSTAMFWLRREAE